jgi:prepilin-type N-terminal cleavage/methylation domain-containing protein
MIRSPRRAGFTLIEMITVIAVIIILVSLVLAVNGLVQRKAAMTRANAEIQALSSACEAYKTDNGGYPQDTFTNQYTDNLDPRVYLTPATPNYYNACGVLYAALSGMTNNGSGVMTQTATNYAPDFFKAARLAGGPNTQVPATYILDPWGNSYGYSTSGLSVQQQYQQALASDPKANPPIPLGSKGYNATFDLWSTGGTTGLNNSADVYKWVKNW